MLKCQPQYKKNVHTKGQYSKTASFNYVICHRKSHRKVRKNSYTLKSIQFQGHTHALLEALHSHTGHQQSLDLSILADPFWGGGDFNEEKPTVWMKIE